MFRIVFGLVAVAHGAVHLLYMGQSARRFELAEGMVWPDGAWLLSRPFGDAATRTIVSVVLVLAAIGFVVGGAALIFSQPWGRPLIVAGGVISVALYLLAWNGRFEALPNQGAIGILISAAFLLAVLVLSWPALES